MLAFCQGFYNYNIDNQLCVKLLQEHYKES